jgi:hypothetical protein
MFDWVFCCAAAHFAETAELYESMRILGNRNPSAKRKSPLNIWNASRAFKSARFIDLRRIPVQK